MPMGSGCRIRQSLSQSRVLEPSPALRCQALATLYGLVRVERAAAFLLAAGALSGADLAAVRTQVNELCGAFAADGGRAALELCAGFGVPEHLLGGAPIASNWRTIGAS